MLWTGQAEADSAGKLVETLDLTALQKSADGIVEGFSVKETVLSLINGRWPDTGSIRSAMVSVARSVLPAVGGALSSILLPICFASLASAVGGDRVGAFADTICAIIAAVAIVALYAGCAQSVANAAARLGALAEGIAPVLSTLLSASGGVATAALLTPAASLLSQLATSVIVRFTLPLIGCAATVAVCPAFSQRFGLGKLRGLLLGVCNWTHGTLVTAFLGLLTVRGLLSAGADSVSMHTARYTVDNLLPVVGGEIADTLELLVASARLVCSGVGVTGLLLTLWLLAGPLLSILSRIVILRLAAALVEPLRAKAAQDLIDGFSDVLRALFVALASAATLFWLLLGSVAAVGNGILR